MPGNKQKHCLLKWFPLKLHDDCSCSRLDGDPSFIDGSVLVVFSLAVSKVAPLEGILLFVIHCLLLLPFGSLGGGDTNTISGKIERLPLVLHTHFVRECSGSVVESLTRDRGAAGSSLTVLCP